jgi:hypothetical protein
VLFAGHGLVLFNRAQVADFGFVVSAFFGEHEKQVSKFTFQRVNHKRACGLWRGAFQPFELGEFGNGKLWGGVHGVLCFSQRHKSIISHPIGQLFVSIIFIFLSIRCGARVFRASGLRNYAFFPPYYRNSSPAV